MRAPSGDVLSLVSTAASRKGRSIRRAWVRGVDGGVIVNEVPSAVVRRPGLVGPPSSDISVVLSLPSHGLSTDVLHNFTTILADAGAASPAKLDDAIANEPSTVHDLLLQKSDGTFELVVWGEKPSGGSDEVTVDLGTPRASVNVYDPTTESAPTQTLKGVASVMLTLSDHPLILEL